MLLTGKLKLSYSSTLPNLPWNVCSLCVYLLSWRCPSIWNLLITSLLSLGLFCFLTTLFISRLLLMLVVFIITHYYVCCLIRSFLGICLLLYLSSLLLLLSHWWLIYNLHTWVSYSTLLIIPRWLQSTLTIGIRPKCLAKRWQLRTWQLLLLFYYNILFLQLLL